MNIFKEIYNQVFPQPPKDTTIVITKSAREGMAAWGINEEIVKDVVLRGTKIKENMISKQFNGYRIGAIAKYEKTTKIYLVLSVWKKDW